MGNVLFGRKKDVPEQAIQKAVLGAGCYWGTEKFVRKHKFQNGKVVDVRVGFAGGAKENPTYRDVCGGDTGHVEVAEVSFTGDIYSELLRLFFSCIIILFSAPPLPTKQLFL
mmetsp:Transcript_26329/g.80981  ORF Transcript_26329/g.80981 Transcript_26329/m.80981 type:complete len:112 (+) Transcript_26329:123-458(+)